MTKPSVFVSYSHKDAKWKDRLVTQLKVLENEGLLSTWDDMKIKAGEDWLKAIELAIQATKVAVLLASAHSLTSGFILKKEVTGLLQRRQAEGLTFFPVIVSPCLWQQVSWLKVMQVRPKDGKPLSGMTKSKADEALAEIAAEITVLIKPPDA